MLRWPEEELAYKHQTHYWFSSAGPAQYGPKQTRVAGPVNCHIYPCAPTTDSTRTWAPTTDRYWSRDE